MQLNYYTRRSRNMLYVSVAILMGWTLILLIKTIVPWHVDADDFEVGKCPWTHCICGHVPSWCPLGCMEKKQGTTFPSDGEAWMTCQHAYDIHLYGGLLVYRLEDLRNKSLVGFGYNYHPVFYIDPRLRIFPMTGYDSIPPRVYRAYDPMIDMDNRMEGVLGVARGGTS